MERMLRKEGELNGEKLVEPHWDHPYAFEVCPSLDEEGHDRLHAWRQREGKCRSLLCLEVREDDHSDDLGCSTC